MGNACGCAEDQPNANLDGNIKGASLAERELEVFKLPNFQSKIEASTFAGLKAEEKDALLTEVVKLITTHGDPVSIKPTNIHLRNLFTKTTQKIVTAQGGEIYDGETIDGTANGKGTVKLADGGSFEGTFASGFRKGRGVTKHTNSTVETYHGEQGRIEGFAVTKAPNGTTSTFLYESNIKTGPALIETPTDTGFETYVAGRRNGLSVRMSKDTKTITLQEFKDDKLFGNSVDFTKDGATQGAPGQASGAQAGPQAQTGPNGQAAGPGQQAGTQGQTGQAGKTGAQGQAGTQGQTGPQGAQQGQTGAQGAQQGQAGAQQGQAGAQGPQQGQANGKAGQAPAQGQQQGGAGQGLGVNAGAGTGAGVNTNVQIGAGVSK